MADIVSVLTTVGLAILYSFVGFGKAKIDLEKFSGPKFVRTLIIGAVVGVVLAWQGYGVTAETMGQAESYVGNAAGGFLVVLIDQVSSWIWKKTHPKEAQLKVAGA